MRDPRTDFTPFIFAQGLAFETEGVIAHLRTLVPITTIATDHQDARSLTAGLHAGQWVSWMP